MGSSCGVVAQRAKSQARSAKPQTFEPLTLNPSLFVCACRGTAESDAGPVLRSFLTSIALATEVSEAGSVANFILTYIFNLSNLRNLRINSKSGDGPALRSSIERRGVCG
jgi:hypothetical protein